MKNFIQNLNKNGNKNGAWLTSSHRDPKGITLIALVITVVILIILAGVAISLSLGDNGLFYKAVGAKEDYRTAVNEEQVGIANIEDAINTITNGGNGEDKVTIEPAEITHEPTLLTYSWEELEKIAEIISNNDDTIKSDTATEVKIKIGETEYVVGVGDTTVVTYDGVAKTVRIMGFNHDTLTSETAYGKDKKNTYAGISFEFLDNIKTTRIDPSGNNTNGWEATELRNILNGDTELNKLGNKDQIKQVYKTYLLGNKSTTTKISQDKLWLLSCSEIWNNGYASGKYGFALGKEGEQYKYYKDINPRYDTDNPLLRKNSDSWWLRSPVYNTSVSYCFAANNYYGVSANGTASYNDYSIVPCFAI